MRRKGRADLHLHSSVSDGILDPGVIISRAGQVGLEWVALCDHDAAALPDALCRAGRAAGVAVIPSVELGLRLEGRRTALAGGRGQKMGRGEIHLLVYGVDATKGPLGALIAEARAERYRRMERMLHRLHRIGIVLHWEDVEEHMAPGASPGRPHLAEALVSGGHATSMSQAFSRYIAPGRPAYVPRERLSLDDAMSCIREAGGLGVLAHPGLHRNPLALIDHLAEGGLGGVEVVHPEHSFGESRELLAHARRRRLLPTGGSDGHGRVGEPPLGSVAVPAVWAAELARVLAFRRNRP